MSEADTKRWRRNMRQVLIGLAATALTFGIGALIGTATG